MNNFIRYTLFIAFFISLTSFLVEKEKPASVSTEVDTQTIYVASNKGDGNTIVAFRQMPDGSLETIGEYATGGKGTDNIEIFDWGYDSTHPLKDGIDPLISAYGVYKTSDSKNLLVVNSGDGTISSLRVNKDKGLTLSSVVKTGDKHPLSIASHNNIVYVASSGTVATPPFSGNITGYRIDSSGKLTAIPNSTRDLAARPTCVVFTEDGKYLVVAELVSGLIKVYGVEANGLLTSEPISTVSSPHDSENGRWLPIPVGFDIVKKGNEHIVIVSEARFLDNMGMLREEADKVPQSPKYSWQTGSTSSYSIDETGTIRLISGDVMTGADKEGGQIANCWVEVSADGNTLWASNALSSSISSYAISNKGALSLKNETAFKKSSETLFFSDTFVSHDGKFLNQLVGNRGAILVFKVMPNGDLKEVGMYTSSDLPAIGAYGLVVL